ncbi:degT/DnrJ/EryC1/StrS aminotransferase family protein [Clostridium sporogenes]|uniref:DegT/DnrJ/EryC1/StrS aminotransferase family protein n=1 Tax=Clostridium sporogenes TaxID=1509 RepID=A0A1L3NHC7_CLOSG|nr:DegT/DnrJ/EryC1/StrS family aminotransferase [Clostridium sporogenes]APH15535.1 degT/DnrJ/EryC1/StrS aminotransferase family protein [Clostridium sporogenes]
MHIFNSKIIKYYFKSDEQVRQTLKYSYDNIFIGENEAQVAYDYINNKYMLKDVEYDINIFKRGISKYIGADMNKIFMFYTAHSGIYFLLCQLKSIHPNKKYVIVPAFTCSVVVNAITAAELKPIFVDIELDTYGVSIDSLKNILDKDSKNILLVIIQHLFGLASRDYDQLLEICKSKNILTMSDAAQSLGTFYNNKSIGSEEDFCIFSMQASKSINTYTGGMLIINNKQYEFKDSYDLLSYPSNEDLQYILKAYYYQYLKKIKNKYTLPIFLKKHKNDFVSSLHPSEENNNKICDLQAHPLENNGIYIKKYPNTLAKIANVQLAKLEDNINLRLKHYYEFSNEYDEEIYIKKNSRPSLIRIPIIKDKTYKSNIIYENGYLVGNWFCYYFGSNKNAQYAATNLVNFLKIDNYY